MNSSACVHCFPFSSIEIVPLPILLHSHTIILCVRVCCVRVRSCVCVRYSSILNQEAVEFCKAHNLPVTVHAGEWPGSQHNISLALELGVDRIGHGWGMAASPDIMEACRKQGVVVEVCLTSNVKPGAGSEWIESYEQHPVRKMVNAGVKVCLNSDNHLLSGAADRRATPTGEIQHLMSSCDFTIDEVIQLLRNGVNASFVPNPGDQADLMARFEAELQNALH